MGKKISCRCVQTPAASNSGIVPKGGEQGGQTMTNRMKIPLTTPPERTGHDQSYSLSSFRARTADSAAPNSPANRNAAASSTEAATRTTSPDRWGHIKNSSAAGEPGNRSAQPCAKARTRNSKINPSDLISTRTSSGRLISGHLRVREGRLTDAIDSVHRQPRIGRDHPPSVLRAGLSPTRHALVEIFPVDARRFRKLIQPGSAFGFVNGLWSHSAAW